MVLFETILSFVILVGVLVFIHELGHFLAARWCGIRVDVFAVGMGPRVMGWNHRSGFTFGRLPEEFDLEGRTDYRISAFPIGGYVKIVGMVDESMDTEFAHKPVEPWEFRSKNTLQKAFVISAGVIMNILLAIALFWGLGLWHGDQHRSPVISSLSSVDSALVQGGVRVGDSIISVAGESALYISQVEDVINRSQGAVVPMTVEREGRTIPLQIPRTAFPRDPTAGNALFIPTGSFVAIDAPPAAGTPAAKGGLAAGDTILAVNGVRVVEAAQFIAAIQRSKGAEIEVVVLGPKGSATRLITPQAEGEDYRIGAALSAGRTGPTWNETYPFFAALDTAVQRTLTATGATFGLVGKLVSGRAELKESVGGPIVIANYAQRTLAEGLPAFLALMAILSVTLAVMNILPVPALDGGHLVFIIIEAVIRREVPLKVRMAVQQVGFALLLIFMIFVFYNDITKVFSQ